MLQQKDSVEGDDASDCHIPRALREVKHQTEAAIWITSLPYCQELVKKSSRYCGGFDMQIIDVY